MKKRFKIIIGLMAGCAAALVCAACSTDGAPYDRLNKNGYTVSIRYDGNGCGDNLVDVLPISMFDNGGVRLLEPGSPERDGDAGMTDVSNRSKLSREGYFLVGWYRERLPRVADDGTPLDEYGIPTEESGRSQGFMYSGLWDFEKDRLELESGKKYNSKEPVCTLYAAWAPEFSYEIYSQQEGAWKLVSENKITFTPSEDKPELLSLKLPSWSSEGGAMNYERFPKMQGKTFEAAYLDKELKNQCEDALVHTGKVDKEKGVATDIVNVYYTTWKNGEWIRVYTAKQFLENYSSEYCFEIFDDLDFAEELWLAGLYRGSFSGQIVGHNHKFSNITVNQTDVSDLRGGLFGNITGTAKICDVTFENVTYNMLMGSRMQDARFGLFTGNLDGKATLENVSVSGKFNIGNVYPLKGVGSAATYYDGYLIGLLTGNDIEAKGVVYDISCQAIEVQSGSETKVFCRVEFDEKKKDRILIYPIDSDEENPSENN